MYDGARGSLLYIAHVPTLGPRELAIDAAGMRVVCADRSDVSVVWLRRPNVEDVLQLWLDETRSDAACAFMTRRLLQKWPYLPNVVVRSAGWHEAQQPCLRAPLPS